jgi:hypothetical protein
VSSGGLLLLKDLLKPTAAAAFSEFYFFWEMRKISPILLSSPLQITKHA